MEMAPCGWSLNAFGEKLKRFLGAGETEITEARGAG